MQRDWSTGKASSSFIKSSQLFKVPKNEIFVTINVQGGASVLTQNRQVIWVNWGLTEHDLETMPAGVQSSFARATINNDERQVRLGLGVDLGDGKGRMLVADEWNSLIYSPLAAVVDAADIHTPKNRMSALWSTEQPLWKHLQSAGKKTLLFAGVNTDHCVLGTLTDAWNAGWDCVMINDCCATATENAKEVCVGNISVS
jgi:nicotinamidase-related amidase